MRFEVDVVIATTHQVGLIDDRHRFTDFDQLVKIFDVLRIKPYATVADTHTDTIGLVRAMDQVTRHLELEHAMAQRIVGPGRNDRR